jgi:hypothetical protein
MGSSGCRKPSVLISIVIFGTCEMKTAEKAKRSAMVAQRWRKTKCPQRSKPSSMRSWMVTGLLPPNPFRPRIFAQEPENAG